tara:strand:- start:612 stop:830 length:219 start_codon:yes stop_codon:yes gene_type:complete
MNIKRETKKLINDEIDKLKIGDHISQALLDIEYTSDKYIRSDEDEKIMQKEINRHAREMKKIFMNWFERQEW